MHPQGSPCYNSYHSLWCDEHCTACMWHFCMHFTHFLWQCTLLACIYDACLKQTWFQMDEVLSVRFVMSLLGKSSWRGHQSGPEGECPVIILQYPGVHGAGSLMPQHWWTVGDCRCGEGGGLGGGGSWGQRHRRCWGGCFSGAQRVVDQLRLVFVLSFFFSLL